jgi:DNA-binding response OmpR family regulator
MTPDPDEAGLTLYAPQQTIRLLFVDDDPILREFAVVNLAAEQTEIETVADSEAALAAIARQAPDIVLLSLEGPSYESLGVLKALRPAGGGAATLGVPVIVVTGREDIEAVDAAYAAGATSFVVKPLNWRLLGRQVRFILRAAAKSGADGDSGQLVALAREGVRFIAQAMAIDPRLKSAAAPFVEAADAALDVRRVNGAG